MTSGGKKVEQNRIFACVAERDHLESISNNPRGPACNIFNKNNIKPIIHVEETAYEFGWKGMKNKILFGGSLRWMSDPLKGRWMETVG